uniref:Uncharacterized protein n=1 Tax=Tetranychus urticae TaxID=32264 RepID=T1KGG9_TETUR
MDQIADHIFILNDGVLKPVEPPGSPMCFILIQYFPFSFNISQVVNKLNAQANGIIKNSAIIYDGAICIGFRYKAVFLTAKLIIDSLLAEILKCIKPEVVMQTKSNKEVKQLTFIKVVHSNEAYQNQIFKFCIAYAAQSGSQCVLSMKSYHWIVFLFKSDAQKFLPKVKMIYSDAVIRMPWHQLTSRKPILPSLDAPKKVLFDGNLYCAQFDSASDYQDAFEKLQSRYLEPLESVHASEAHKLKAVKKMIRCSGTPCKSILGNRECIFIKSIPGETWIGFPDEDTCKNSDKNVDGFVASLKQQNDMSIAKPSKELLESINLQDLAGDAYDLAFLSSQLEVSKPIKRPNFIEQIRLQRMQEQECDETVFHFTVSGQFYSRWTSHKLALEQIVKIFVNFSKVIPLAATASVIELNSIYNSWHEALAAQHFLKKLTTAEVPYLQEFREIGSIRKPQLACSKYSEYYIINDKRKVLEKIVQNKSLLDSISFTVQSTTDLGVLIFDDEMIKKLQYLFVITTNSEFKFTSGMISIIKLNLIQMDCPVCIEFEDKVWVGVEYLKKGNKVKTRIDQIKFKLLHEKDDDDFEVGVVMESIQESPPEVAEMLASKLMNTKKSVTNIYLNYDFFPLGHFNYSYRKAVGMPISRFCQLNV